ncbi:MAG: dTDP-4-dehydrorhamnose reductase [Xanthomonadaceae bacterium]|jgi:dTDP-4-dehydrorhamnose reductase|nr:dTDP-4-dehydrorhamnose reductase [Xanthomonadaceae bacterium]
MKILLLGGNGQLGIELRRRLNSVADVVIGTRDGRLIEGGICETADFLYPETLPAVIERIAPDVVINAAAYTAVDRAEDDTGAAYRINAEAPGVLADACHDRDILLVHYSTDYVFDGTASHPYHEDDPPAPLSVYGASKWAGETAIRNADGRHLILRTAWVYAAHGHNFLRTILRLSAEREELRIVSDQIGTPTSTALIADITTRALTERTLAVGTYHLTAGGQSSWYEFAEAIVTGAVERKILPHSPRLVPIATTDYPTRAHRPGYSLLDITKIAAVMQETMIHWRKDLAHVLDEIQSHKAMQ